MNYLQTGAFLRAAAGKKIMVIGDLMLDRYVWGTAERISPEAPIPVVAVEREEQRPGGAGNVACNLLRIGCEVLLAAVIGDDEEGFELKQILDASGVNTYGVKPVSGRITTCKTRILANHQQMLRLDREETTVLNQEQEQLLFDYINETVSQVGVVLLSDYLKGVLTESLLERVISLCRKQGCPVIVDPKAQDFIRYCGATLITPNLHEAEKAAGVPIHDETSLNAVAETLQSTLPGSNLLITRGRDGMTLFDEKGVVNHLPTEAREVFDVSGAGDTVLAFLGAGLATGMSLLEAARLANLAAGIAVGKVGTAVVEPADLLLHVGSSTEEGGSNKVIPALELSVLLQWQQQNGKKVVFTNGCFDLLHAGHVKYLQQAKRLGDILVLGLNSDASVRRLKGEKRPLLKQDERSQILAALDCIDYITIFEEETPTALISLLRPDILTKGGDYQGKKVAGQESVENSGGRLVVLEFEDGKSTTHIIDEVLTRYRE